MDIVGKQVKVFSLSFFCYIQSLSPHCSTISLQSMNQTDIDELISWFADRAYPTGHFRISKWETTLDLADTVAITIEHARRGNQTSIEVLGRMKYALNGASSE